ncbi:helix-turn-helix domain-containing protein [Enterococcus faecalis]|uniref:helix-turn-helix transcriptional regulator n=1 Tax=Bacillati TaxID=1783272 RepID=UPI00254F24C9|nr:MULTISPECIES: helix-turn-helix domain-containing protein [Terrabacteria group]MDK8490438.1 helix-turn-helix domain-containing protein [Enterococcus faecalis]MDK8828027.1 helix-turn-helix domain-containing protein [Corynebacterium sp. MSK012]
MSAQPKSRWVSVSGIAEEYGLSTRTVYRLIDDGKIEASYVTPRALRVNRESMEALIERNAA